MGKLVLLSTAAAAFPLSALADPAEGWRDGYGHMMWGGYGILGGLMMLIFWGVVIALIVLAVRWLSETRPGGPGNRRDALEILRERYAAGEIDDEEFQRRKRLLES